MRIPFLSKDKFVLIIGDDGAILSYIKGNVVSKKIFAKSAGMTDRREINSVLKDNPEIPVYILIDTIEQSFTKQTLPAVNSFAVGKLINKRLERDFAATDIKGAMLLGKEDTGRRDWIYLFSATPLTESLQAWISYIESIENRFAGIYMLPIEMESFVKKIAKTLPKPSLEKAEHEEGEEDEEAPVHWHFIATFNKTGGVRQVVLENGKVVFTRLIKTGKDSLPDIVAGNIEQELLNTVDYMRRLNFSEKDHLDVILVVPDEIKKSMDQLKVQGNPVNIYTPFEVSEVVGLKGVAAENDKFADIVIAANFANSSHSLRLTSANMQKFDTIVNLNRVSFVAILLIIPVFIVYSLVSAYKIYDYYDQIKALENQKASIEKRWKSARKTEEYSIDDANKISDFIALFKELSKNIEPFGVIKKISIDNREDVSTSSVAWSFEEIAAKRGKKIYPVEKVIFNLEFENKGETLDQLFSNFEAFSRSILSNSSDYEIELSDLPDKIDFNNKDRVIPVKITMTTKIDKKNK